MGRIRVVGRTRGGRCVFCHDALRGEVRHCPECHAGWHPECGEASTRPRCPTIGCTGPAPAAEVRRGRRRRPLSTAEATPDAQVVRRRRRPGALARFGPYARLVLSAVVTTAVLGASAWVFAWPVHNWREFWHFVNTDKHWRGVPLLFGLFQLAMVLGLAGIGVWYAGRWLLQIPSVWRELGQLLDETTPVAMRLTTYTTGSGKSRRRWARLSSIERGQGTITLCLDGLLPPWWLRFKEGERVLVYGLPPPGPYILEFEDGLLALIHPDE